MSANTYFPAYAAAQLVEISDGLGSSPYALRANRDIHIHSQHRT